MFRRSVFFIGFLTLVAALSFAGGRKEELPKEINISFVESPFNLQVMIMRERRLLEQAFEPKGIAVKWHHITSGAHQAQAIAAGSLDIASVIGSTSVLIANAAGNTVKIAGIVSRPRQTFALLTKQDGPRSIKELRGKNIAGPKGTVLHQMLVSALTSEGMSEDDINFISMALPDARAALLADRIDGALQAGSLIIRGKEAGLRVLFTGDGYITPVLVTAVRPLFAEKYPALVSLYLEAQQEAYAWIRNNRKEAVAIGSRIHNISEADGMRLFEWSGIASRMIRDDLKAMNQDVAFLLEQDMIQRPVKPEDLLLPATIEGN